MFLIHHLGIMVTAGIAMHEALKTLSEEVEGKRFKAIVYDLSILVAKGSSLAESLARYPHIFSELFVNMVRAGETSGKLEETLKELHLELAKDHALKSKVRNALIYPAAIIIVMIGISIFMMTVVIPRLLSIFDQIHATLPLPTQIVIGISRFITTHGILVSLTAIVNISALILFIRTTRGKALYHGLLIRLPAIGVIVRRINLARCTRTLSSLLKTDIPFSQSLTITGNVLANVHYRNALHRFAQVVKQGVTLEELMKKETLLFPPLVRQMVGVGERTGTLDTTLGEIATFYEEEVHNTMETLPALIEPILIVVLGLGVAGLAVAIIMPMYSLAQQF